MGGYKTIVVAGLKLEAWVNMFNGCHSKDSFGSHIQFAWPDGGSYLSQHNVTIVLFDLIRSQYDKINSEKIKKEKTRKR